MVQHDCVMAVWACCVDMWSWATLYSTSNALWNGYMSGRMVHHLFYLFFALLQDQHSSIFQHNASPLPTPIIHQHTAHIIVITTVLVLQILLLSIEKMLVILRVQTRIHVQALSFWHSVQVGWSIDQRAQTMMTNTACAMSVVRIACNDQCSSANSAWNPSSQTITPCFFSILLVY